MSSYDTQASEECGISLVVHYDSVRKKLCELKIRQKELHWQINEILKRISNIETTSTNFAEEIARLDTLINNVNTTLADMSTSIDNINLDITSINNDITSLTTAITNINATLDTLPDNIQEEIQVFHIQEQYNSGTNGVASPVNSELTTVFNTILRNEIPGASLNQNLIHLPPGKYLIEARAPSYRANGHRIRAFSVAQNTTLLLGSNAYSSSLDLTSTDSVIRGIVESAQNIEFYIYHYSTTSGGNFGVALTRANLPEVYAELIAYKLS